MIESFARSPFMSMNPVNGEKDGKDSSKQKKDKKKNPLPPATTTPHAPGSEGADPHTRNEPRDRGGH